MNQPGQVDGANAPLTRTTLWTYGALAMPLSLLSYPLAVWLPRAYSTDVGISLSLVGLIISAAALFDAITDPVIGVASDSWQTRWGRRKAWLAAGVPLLTLACWMLLNPAGGATAAYLGLWYLLLRLGSTLVLVPYGAWGAELTGDYHQRTRVSSARQQWSLLGLIVATLVPAFAEFRLGDAATAVVILEAYGWLVLILLPGITLAMLLKIPEPATPRRPGGTPLYHSLRLMWRNGLFRRVVLIELVITGGEQFRNTVSLFFMQDAIGISSPGILYVIYFACGLAAMPLWDQLARRFGKHRSLAAAMVLVSLVSLAIFALDHGDQRAFQILFALKGMCFGAFAYLPLAMLADVVDLDTLRSGDQRTGSYFAVHGFMTKCAASFGGLSLPLLALAGYSAAPDASNDATALYWLGVVYAIIPTLLFAVAFWLTWTWPLTAHRHRRVRSALGRRLIRSGAAGAGERGNADIAANQSR